LAAKSTTAALFNAFDNASGEHYLHAELGLIRLGAIHSLQLFGSASVPQDQAKRWKSIRKKTDEPGLDPLDTEFYKDTDQLDEKLESFAVEVGLVKNS